MTVCLSGTVSSAARANNPPAACPFSVSILYREEEFSLSHLDGESMDATKRRYLAFDIETAKVMPEDESDLKSHRPLGISCAATFLADSKELRLWHGGDQMTREEAADLVHYLEDRTREGYPAMTPTSPGYCSCWLA